MRRHVIYYMHAFRPHICVFVCVEEGFVYIIIMYVLTSRCNAQRSRTHNIHIDSAARTRVQTLSTGRTRGESHPVWSSCVWLSMRSAIIKMRFTLLKR